MYTGYVHVYIVASDSVSNSINTQASGNHMIIWRFYQLRYMYTNTVRSAAKEPDSYIKC